MALRSEKESFFKTNLFVRICSAVVLAPIILMTGWMGGWAFFCVVVVASLFVQSEWTRMCLPDITMKIIIGLSCLLAVQLLLIQSGYQTLACYLIGFSIFTLLLISAFLTSTIWNGAGHAYAILFGTALLLIRGEGYFGMIALAFIVAVVWSTDVFAYFVGRAVGGAKLWPTVSPGKTWSGAVGGLCAGVLAGAVFYAIVPNTSILYLGLLGMLLSIASQFGDLFESALKRRCGVKDSGRVIPGHGGVMDRVDGLVFAAVLALLVSFLLRGNFENPGSALLFGFH